MAGGEGGVRDGRSRARGRPYYLFTMPARLCDKKLNKVDQRCGQSEYLAKEIGQDRAQAAGEGREEGLGMSGFGGSRMTVKRLGLLDTDQETVLAEMMVF
ncbi:hypothetical protein RRG08_035401 [Elysia crispata]|uniref:Uncharacterized protein n=1 Tax=Elysia crispata TaxID=231223 RepID=A0AAE0Y3E6_9GAST|nr:hypothetical protein RRG08_035401 [Elysia crispata]